MEKIRLTRSPKRIPRAKSIIERALWERCELVCGVDEVGRGCLAGPLVTAAVILHPGATFALLKDSKLLSVQDRERAACWIKQHSWYAYGVASHHEIDVCNIYQATLLAMRRAVAHVLHRAPKKPALIVVDAMPLSFTDQGLKSMAIDHFPGAEQRSISVAAASIIAKVKRDELMGVFGTLFPGYALEVHKGYATHAHRLCVAQQGCCLIHRQSFLHEWFRDKVEVSYERQVELFG